MHGPINIRIFSSISPHPETKRKYFPEMVSVIIKDPVRRFAYILASEEGCQGSSFSVKVFEVQKAMHYSFYWLIVEFYGQDI